MIIFKKNASVQGDYYKIRCLLDYNYFKNQDKMIAIDLSRKQALDTDPKEIQLIHFTVNLARNSVANTTMFFIIE